MPLVDHVVARRLTIVDPSGRRRIELAFENNGEPSVRLYSADGVSRMMLGMVGSDPFMALADSAGQARLILRLQSNQDGNIAFQDANGTMRAMVRGDTVTGGVISAIHGANGSVQGVTMTFVDQDGDVDIGIVDGHGNPVWRARFG